MPLDMFQQTQSDTDAYVAQQNSPRLPVTFDEAFEKSWNENRLFGQSTAVLNAHSAALGDYLDEVHRKSGVLISPLNQMGDQKSLDEIGFDVGELRKKRPDLDIPDLTDDDIDRRAVAKSRQARTDYQDMSAAEKTGGGKFGSVLGGLAGGLTDPVNLVAAPLAAPESLGLLGTALAWGAIAGTTQAANEAIGSPYRDKVQPGYSQSAEPAQNILEAAGFGAVTGAGFKALGNVWTRAKTGAWPRSVRDAGNIVESEANVAQTNALAESYLPKPLSDAEITAAVSGQPTPEAQAQLLAKLKADQQAAIARRQADIDAGMSMSPLQAEVMHRDALNKAIDDVLAGRAVNVDDILAPTRDLIARLEAQSGMTLPIINERALNLLGEEAGLQERQVVLRDQLVGLPEGDASAADRLNRLQAIEQQISETSDSDALRVLNQRRDQILVDTTPERLRTAAAPIEQRRRIETEQAAIADRLKAIGEQKDKFQIDGASTGRRMVVPHGLPFDQAKIEALHTHAAAAKAEALEQPVSRSATEQEPAPQPRTQTVVEMNDTLTAPDHQDAIRADIDRARATADFKVPGVDENGNHIMVGVDKAVDEVDAYKAAAEQIQACANPVQDEAAE